MITIAGVVNVGLLTLLKVIVHNDGHCHILSFIMTVIASDCRS